MVNLFSDQSIDALLRLSVIGTEGDLGCNEDFRDYPLRLSLTLWAILEMSWDQKLVLPRPIAVLLGKLGAVDVHPNERLTINAHIANFISESLKSAAQRDLPYCQNPRFSKTQGQNIQEEDLGSMPQVRRACNLLFGDLSQYQWNKVLPEKNTRLTFFKFAYAAALLSRGQGTLEQQSRLLKALRLHLPFAAKNQDGDEFRRDLNLISREVTLILYGEGLGKDRSVILTMLALLASALLIFDKKYTQGERSILQVFFKRFAVTQQEVTQFKSLCQKQATDLFRTIPEPNRFSTMVYMLATLLADHKISGGEREYLEKLNSCHLWTPDEQLIFTALQELV